jgi:hypothetical protein
MVMPAASPSRRCWLAGSRELVGLAEHVSLVPAGEVHGVDQGLDLFHEGPRSPPEMFAPDVDPP